MFFKIIVAVVIAWAAWRMWQGWGRPMPGTPKAPAAPTGREAEARAILGVASTAGPEEIRAAHRRLIASVHPDRGGSPELTRQVNAARDTLLKNTSAS